MNNLIFRPSRNFFLDLVDNSKAVFWVLAGSRRAFTWVIPNIWQFVFLACTALASNALFGWLSSQSQGVFNPQGLVSYLLWPFIALLLGIFLANRRGVSDLMLVPAILWLGADTAIALFQSLIQYIISIHQFPDWVFESINALYFILFIWQTAALLWVMAKMFHWPWWEQLLMLLAVFSILIVWQKTIINQPIWQTPEIKQPEISADILYAQPRLLDDALVQIQKSEQRAVAPASNWYFMGIAGAGYQDVFSQELSHVRQLFEQRFGLFGHVLTLSNNNKTFTTEPMATLTSIDRGLGRMAHQMKLNATKTKEQDVLVMVLTSHGAPNLFELSNAPFKMESLRPEWLRERLDSHHFKWRVLIISACYSGSFIPALQSPDTLIITASSADKSSFGCTNKADYTYFGKAYFAHALPQQKSFVGAFEQAQLEIKTLEKQKGVEASNPQIKIGSEIAKVLPRLERNLFDGKLTARHLADFAANAQIEQPMAP